MGILTNFFIGDDELANSLDDTLSIPNEDKIETRNVMDLYIGFLY